MLHGLDKKFFNTLLHGHERRVGGTQHIPSILNALLPRSL